jgi:hypothetical protein
LDIDFRYLYFYFCIPLGDKRSHKNLIEKGLIKIGGELGMKVSKVRFSLDNDLTNPFTGHDAFNLDQYIDMDIFENDGNVLHICGKNDWGYLMVDALMPLIKYADNVLQKIRKMLDEYDGKPEVIVLGRNEYRAVDIIHRLRGNGDPINVFLSIPVVKSEQNNYIKLLGNKPREF